MGQLQNGWTLEYFENGIPVIGDNFGQNVQDVIHAGLEVFVNLEMMIPDSAAGEGIGANPFWPWSTTFGTGAGIGSLTVANSRHRSLILDGRANSEVAGVRWTFAKTHLQNNQSVQHALRSTALRTVPFRFRVFDDGANPPVYFVKGLTP